MFKKFSLQDFIVVVVMGMCFYGLIIVGNKDSQPSSVEMRETTMNCMPITISGAGMQDLRADVNLKFDVVVCENGLGQAVINNNYDVFVNDMIAENEEWQ